MNEITIWFIAGIALFVVGPIFVFQMLKMLALIPNTFNIAIFDPKRIQLKARYGKIEKNIDFTEIKAMCPMVFTGYSLTKHAKLILELINGEKYLVHHPKIKTNLFEKLYDIYAKVLQKRELDIAQLKFNHPGIWINARYPVS